MDPHDEFSMDPGPRDASVLHLQSTHRSSAVWKAGGGDSQRSRRRNPNQTRFPQLHKRMIPILTDLRFDGVCRLSCIAIDWSLITALVERWRPETHTFHLPVGECTITLQDVNVLLGLRIDGDAVSGYSAVDGGWTNLIEQIFGKKPLPQYLKGGRLLLSWLTSAFPSLSDDASNEELIRYTQSYLLQLIAGVLFTDHSGGQIHCMYIPLIQDLERCRNLAWGAAVLAYLFRELCKSCRIGVEENAGCLLLLQLWAWTRLPTLAPIPRGPSLDNPSLWDNMLGPYGMRWCSHLKFTDTSSHVLSTHRLSLDGLAPSHFIWQPYSELLATLPDCCVDGSSIWCYKGPLICFHIVEPHIPDRCLRQFGIVQEIPPNDAYLKELHCIKLQGKQDTDWRFLHRDHISQWDHRAQRVITGNTGVGVVDGYDQWYASITRLYHTRVGGSHLFAVQLLEHICLVARGEIDGDMSYIDSIASNGRQILQNQFNHGVFQDFPIEDRRGKEIEIKQKSKKIGHKGGRGGINAPRKQGMDDMGMHLKEGGYNRDDNEGIHLGDEGGFVGENSTHVIENQEGQRDLENIVISTPGDVLPNWNLIPSNDSLLMSPHSHQVSPPREQAIIHHSPPLSYPTFNLFTQSQVHTTQHQMAPQQPIHEQMTQQHSLQKQPVQQSMHQEQVEQELVNEQLFQQSKQHMLPVDQQQMPPAQQEQMSPAKQEQVPPVQAVQQQQQRVQHEHIMQLRTRKASDRDCGTGSKKNICRPYTRRNPKKK